MIKLNIFHKALSIILIMPFNYLYAQTVYIRAENVQVKAPVTSALVEKTLQCLNTIFNSVEFKDSLEKYDFVCTNKPDICDTSETIKGSQVYKDLIKSDTITINIRVKKLKNPWKRSISKTLGETPPSGNTITTYTWWLETDTDTLLADYTAHIGHEIFHTKYFQYIHDPEYGSKDFVNDRDVTYKIDDILEALIRKYCK